MNYTLLFTQTANDELAEATEKLDDINPQSANRFLNQLDTVRKTILTFPSFKKNDRRNCSH